MFLPYLFYLKKDKHLLTTDSDTIKIDAAANNSDCQFDISFTYQKSVISLKLVYLCKLYKS